VAYAMTCSMTEGHTTVCHVFAEFERGAALPNVLVVEDEMVLRMDTVEDAGFCGDNSTTCVEGF
jgi:hypothetical protein